MAFYLHVFNTHSVKTNTTSKQKLYEVTRKRRSLSSVDFRKAWIGGIEPTLEKERKGALGTEDNATSFSMLPA